MIKTYSEMIQLQTFEERFNYLKLPGIVAAETFGYDRYLNQSLYSSYAWKKIRNEVILRDNGCDLAIEGREIKKYLLVHHINPVTLEDISNQDSKVFDLENLVCVSHRTHNAIHYGDETNLILNPVERKPNDTCPWR